MEETLSARAGGYITATSDEIILDEDFSDSPESLKIKELELLRVENDTLRRKLKSLEKSVGSMEKQKIGKEEEAVKLSSLIKRAYDAKEEVMKYSEGSREKMQDEIKSLHGLLQKAKAERHIFMSTIREKDEELRLKDRKIEEVEKKARIDREIFAKMVKDDRDTYAENIKAARDKVGKRKEEKREIYVWAKEEQDQSTCEVRKLTRALVKLKKEGNQQLEKRNEVYHEILNLRRVLNTEE